MADPARLAQVISNLLTNAAKYTPSGGQIRITAQADGDEVVLSVRDSGIGIDADMLPRIFDLFTQDRQAIDRAQGGLGLGLAIVRSLVALHGGSITARSDGRGSGSEFVVRLPRIDARQACRGAEVAPAAPRRRSHGGASRARRRRQRGRRADAGRRALGGRPRDRRSRTTARPRSMPPAQFKPDVALLDIGLPVMDGFELARQFRALPELQRTRLIAITGYGQDHDRRRSAAAGFDAHLVKPVDIEHLGRLAGKLMGFPEKAG